MGQRGKLSETWGRYTGGMGPAAKPSVRYTHTKGFISRDPMCDYVEGAEWWIARSRRSTSTLQRAFDRGDMAICLTQRVGAIIEIGRTDSGDHIIGIQIVNPDWDTDLCLSESEIIIDDLWDGESDVPLDHY